MMDKTDPTMCIMPIPPKGRQNDAREQFGCVYSETQRMAASFAAKSYMLGLTRAFDIILETVDVVSLELSKSYPKRKTKLSTRELRVISDNMKMLSDKICAEIQEMEKNIAM